MPEQKTKTKKKEKAPLGEIGSYKGRKIWEMLSPDVYNPDKVTISTYDKMRKNDGQVQAILLVLDLPICSVDWSILPASSDPFDQLISEFVRWNLFEGMSISFIDFIREALSMHWAGFSLFEKVWQVTKFDDSTSFVKNSALLEDEKTKGLLKEHFSGNLTTYKKLASRDPTSIGKFTTDEEGGIAFSWQGQTKIPISKLVLFSNRKEFGNFWGQSFLRAAHKHWFIKDFIYESANIYYERAGAPIPVGKLPEDFSSDDRDYLQKIVDSLRYGSEGGVVLPPGYDIVYLEAKERGANYLRYIEHHDLMIAKSILAQFLNLGRGGGSFALSRDQSDFFLMALRSQADFIAETVSKYVIKDLVSHNFATSRFPILRASGFGEIDVKSWVDVIDKLISGKVVSPTEGWIREKLRIPAPPKEEVAEAKEEKEREKESSFLAPILTKMKSNTVAFFSPYFVSETEKNRLELFKLKFQGLFINQFDNLSKEDKEIAEAQAQAFLDELFARIKKLVAISKDEKDFKIKIDPLFTLFEAEVVKFLGVEKKGEQA